MVTELSVHNLRRSFLLLSLSPLSLRVLEFCMGFEVTKKIRFCNYVRIIDNILTSATLGFTITNVGPTSLNIKERRVLKLVVIVKIYDVLAWSKIMKLISN